MPIIKTLRAAKDPVLTSAVELAREALLEVAEHRGDVGEHLGSFIEDERLVSHRFACTSRGYRGWQWTVIVTRPPRGRVATVSEIALLPGDDAVLSPVWVPWAERLRPGDVGPGDVLPFLADDDRLDPGYTATGDEDADALAIYELGLGRERVLSRKGRAETAERWYTGQHGPTAPQAVAAAAPCSTCGFWMPLQGSLRTVFGACGNEWSPDDGLVVSADHGCGAHSQTDAPAVGTEWPVPDPLVNDLVLEAVDLDSLPDAEPADPAPVAEAAEVAPADDLPAEDLPAEDLPSGSMDEAAEPAEAPAPQD